MTTAVLTHRFVKATDRPSAPGRLAMAAGLLALTVVMGVGIFAATMVFWVPRVRAAFDDRKSIAATLSATIASGGVEAAARQYRELKAAHPATYNFAERELNSLGYELLRSGRAKDAVRVFQLNVEAYPRSSNAYDSLAEGYMEDGDRPQAIANYREALRLDPKNGNAVLMLQKLVGPR
jgi:tetratricopeptide (TPR) repeat protein